MQVERLYHLLKLLLLSTHTQTHPHIHIFNTCQKSWTKNAPPVTDLLEQQQLGSWKNEPNTWPLTFHHSPEVIISDSPIVACWKIFFSASSKGCFRTTWWSVLQSCKLQAVGLSSGCVKKVSWCYKQLSNLSCEFTHRGNLRKGAAIRK